MNIINHISDYHINMVYCGGSCISYYKEYNQTLKLFMSEYSNNHMIVSSSDWTDYNDVIKYRESKYYCMISNGCVISISMPSNIYTEYGDECVIVKITNDNEP
jgi:hypothetical protein